MYISMYIYIYIEMYICIYMYTQPHRHNSAHCGLPFPYRGLPFIYLYIRIHRKGEIHDPLKGWSIHIYM